jgi:peptidyl-prolyl cis-trans isomerase A (cyclophilin A)
MRRSVHVIVVLAFALGLGGAPACQKADSTGNANPGGSDPAAADHTGQPGGIRPIARPPIAHQLPAEPVDQEPAPAGEVRAPVAADLAEYVKDIPGTGPLMATIETSLGTIHCRLYGDQVPMTVANFVGLATGKKPWRNPKTGEVMKGVPFFDGLVFHRVIPDFMIQGGDPLGRGVGGPGYEFADEFVDGLGLDKPGVLASANAGPDTNGSQFFITEKATPWLTHHHTVFGQCKEVDVVKKITSTPRDGSDRPLSTVVIKKVTISHTKK